MQAPKKSMLLSR